MRDVRDPHRLFRRLAAVFVAAGLVIPLALFAQQARDAAPRAGATVGGRVINTAGQPVGGATVSLDNRMSWKAGTTTGTDGRFSFTHVPPGRYSLVAERRGFMRTAFGALGRSDEGTRLVIVAQETHADLTLTMTPFATVSGVVLGPDGAPAAGISMSLANAGPGGGQHGAGGVSDSSGRFTITNVSPGRYRVVAPYYLHALPLPRGVQTPVYHPGTVDPAGATLLEVAAGDTRALDPFRIAPTPVGGVIGVVLRADGTPAAGARVFLGNSSGLQGPSLTRPPDADGRFEFASVPPGRYRLRASLEGPSKGQLQEVALKNVEVGVAGRADVVVTLAAPGRFAGRVRFVGTGTPPDVDTVRVFVNAVGYIPREVDVRADGTFESQFFPGLHVINAHTIGPDKTIWRLRSALSGGVDLFERGMAFGPDSMDYTDVELTLADSGATLTGTVWSAPGVPASDVWVVVFPAERAAWRSDLHRIARTRPDTDGRYSLTDLTPGHYLIALAERLDLTDDGTRSFLESLFPTSTSVTLQEGQPTTVDLPRGRR